MAEGLAAAHARGVVHRDVKPENIMITDSGARVLDFGIALVEGGGFTRAGMIPGTPGYLAPERRSGVPASSASDIWSLGAVVFEMISGGLPPSDPGRGPPGGASDGIPSPSRFHPDVPPELDALLCEMLRADPAGRPDSMAEVAEALRRIAAGSGTPERVPETPGWGRRFGVRFAALAALAALVLLAVGSLPPMSGDRTAIHASGGFASGDEVPLSRDRALLLPFANRTGIDSLEAVGAWAAEWIAFELARAGIGGVVPTSVVQTLGGRLEAEAGILPEAERVRFLAREMDARTVVTGAVFREGDRLEFQLRMLDGETGLLLRTLEPASAPVTRPSEAFDLLRNRAASAWAALEGTDFAPFTALQSQPPTYGAYREFALGSNLFAGGQFERAIPHFERAAALDSTYTLPLIYQALAFGNAGLVRIEGAVFQPIDSLLIMVETRRESLPPYDLHFLEFARAVLSPYPDWGEALRSATELRRLAPGARTDYDVGANLVRLNRPQAAVVSFRELDPTRGELRGWIPYWAKLTEAHHLMANHEDELEAAGQARVMEPRSARALGLELRARAALGHAEEVVRAVDSLMAAPTSEEAHPAHLVAEDVLLELAVHGPPQATEQVHRALVSVLERRLASSPEDSDVLEDLLMAHTAAEAWEELFAMATRMNAGAERGEMDAVVLGLLGIAFARTGRMAEARGLRAELASREGAYDMGRRSMSERGDRHPKRWAAEVAAAAGEVEEALDLLREARREGLRHGTWLHVAPGLRYLRDDPRFRELLRPDG